jgi:hypothetical protein
VRRFTYAKYVRVVSNAVHKGFDVLTDLFKQGNYIYRVCTIRHQISEQILVKLRQRSKPLD